MCGRNTEECPRSGQGVPFFLSAPRWLAGAASTTTSRPRAATFQYPIIPQRCALAGHRAGSTQHGIDRPFLSNPPPRHTCTSLRRAPALPGFGFHTAREKKSTHRNAVKFYQSHFHFRPSSSLSDSTLRMAGTNSNHESKSDRGPITIPPIESNVVVTTKEEMDESDRALVAMGYKPVS